MEEEFPWTRFCQIITEHFQPFSPPRLSSRPASVNRQPRQSSAPEGREPSEPGGEVGRQGPGEVAGDGRESGAKQAEKPPDMRATDRSRPSVDRLRERFRTTIMGGGIVYSSFFS